MSTHDATGRATTNTTERTRVNVTQGAGGKSEQVIPDVLVGRRKKAS